MQLFTRLSRKIRAAASDMTVEPQTHADNPPDAMGVITTARARFGRSPRADEDLEIFASAISDVPIPADHEAQWQWSVEGERLTRAVAAAALEYLDARNSGVPDDPRPADWLVIEAAQNHLRWLSGHLAGHAQESVFMSLMIDGLRLGLITSVALLRSPSAVTNYEERILIAQAASRLVADSVELTYSSDSNTLSETIWLVRIAGDALDLSGDPRGRSLLKRLRKVEHSNRAAKRSRNACEKYIDKEAGISQGRPISDADICSAIKRQHSPLPDAEAGGLARVSAVDPDRFRFGRGILAVDKRALRESRRSLILLPFGPVVMGIVLLFVLQARRQFGASEADGTWDWSPLALKVEQETALTVCLGLLAVSATLAVALAIAPRVVPGQGSDDTHRLAAIKRWWTMGGTLIYLCALTSLSIGTLVTWSTSRNSWPVAIITLIIGLLNWVLVTAVYQIWDGRHIALARLRRSLAFIEDAEHQAEANDDERPTGTLTKNYLRIAGFCAGPSLALVVVAVVFEAVRFGLSIDTAKVALLGTVAAFYLAIVPAVAGMAAIEAHKAKDPESDRLTRVMLTSMAGLLSLLLVLSLVSLGLTLATPAGWVIVSLISAAWLAPTAILVRHRVNRADWPRWPLRIARIQMQQEKSKARLRIQQHEK